MEDTASRSPVACIGLSARLSRQLGAPSSALRAVAERDDDAVIVRTAGEVDAGNESIWRRLLAETAAAAAPDASLIVDLTGLTFVSCGALETLVQQSRWCRRRGMTMKVVTEQTVIRHVLGACRDGDPPLLFFSVDAALGRDPHPPVTVTSPKGILAQGDRTADTAAVPNTILTQRIPPSALRRLSGTLAGLLARRRRHPPHVGYAIEGEVRIRRGKPGQAGTTPTAV